MKLQDWQTRLETFMRERQKVPFAWGHNDCCTFASDAVMSITGQDPAPPGLRSHRTAKQAYRAIKRHGGIAAIATIAMGAPVPVLSAQVGDVVLVTVGKRDALAICNGGTALAPSAAGLVAVGMAQGRMAWRVV